MTQAASVAVSADLDLSAIILAAGGDPTLARYEDGHLFVPGIEQEALDAAVAHHDGAAAAKTGLRAYAAAKRYAVETGGISVGDAPIATDRESQALINGAFNLSQAKPDAVFKFKAGGGFVNLDSAAIQIIAIAVGEHVQACFTKEADVGQGIASGAITSAGQIDAAFAGLSS